MDVSWRVKALDAAMQATGQRIADATSVSEVQALRARRESLGAGPFSGVADTLGGWVFGRRASGVQVEDRTLPGPAGELGVRLYRDVATPEGAPLLVHLHGGGWVLGSLDGGDWWCSSVAAEAGVVVASVDYRLAPEHPAPAGIDDAVAATRWLAEHAGELDAGGPVAVGGDSAGGNLATLVALAARDGDGPPLAAQVLVYPAVDLTMSFPSTLELADAPILRRVDMEAFRSHYLDGSALAPDDARVSPWFAEDLAGLPAALVQIAEQDPLRDEGRAYADRLRDAGVEVRATEYVGAPHGFASLPGACPQAARQSVAEVAAFLRRHLHV
ncbi:alpha/beta hydrolase [Nitriliruptoraceae bacterium ZYF776]|nr:alpha/beta hydrolase [Profundirhabdus halotolerans]